MQLRSETFSLNGKSILSPNFIILIFYLKMPLHMDTTTYERNQHYALSSTLIPDL